MEFVRELDFLFSSEFKFSVFKKSSFKSTLGGILTILTVTLSALLSFYFGADLYYRTNPNIVYNQVVPETYPAFNITKDNFLLYYQLQDGNGNPIPIEPYLYFHTYYYQAKVIDGGGVPIIYNTSYIASAPCDLSLVSNETYFKSKKMSQFRCLNLTNPDQTLQGYEVGRFWDGDFVNYFYMVLSFCQNKTSDIKESTVQIIKQSKISFIKGEMVHLSIFSFNQVILLKQSFINL